MGKSSRRNRKKNPKQFKINQQNAQIKKKNCGQQRSKGHIVVAGGKASGSAISCADRRKHKHKTQYKYNFLKDSYTEFGFIYDHVLENL